MVSRQNLSGRGHAGGVLGRVYKGPSGPGKVTPPGMENRALVRGRQVLDGRDSGPIDAGGVPAPASGVQAPGQKPLRGKGIFNQVQSAIGQRRSMIEADREAKYPTTSPGVAEGAGRRRVPGPVGAQATAVAENARAERELAQNAGGTESLVSMSRSPRSRSRRTIR